MSIRHLTKGKKKTMENPQPITLEIQRDYLMNQLGRVSNDPYFTNMTDVQKSNMKQMFIALIDTVHLAMKFEELLKQEKVKESHDR